MRKGDQRSKCCPDIHIYTICILGTTYVRVTELRDSWSICSSIDSWLFLVLLSIILAYHFLISDFYCSSYWQFCLNWWWSWTWEAVSEPSTFKACTGITGAPGGGCLFCSFIDNFKASLKASLCTLASFTRK